jgi:hypothetical protein
MNTKMHMSFLHLFFLTYIILDPPFFPGCQRSKTEDVTLCVALTLLVESSVIDLQEALGFFFCLLNLTT